MQPTRTDHIRRAIDATLEAQRPCLDAGAPLTTVAVFVDLHPDGNVRRVKFRTDNERGPRDANRAVLISQRREEWR